MAAESSPPARGSRIAVVGGTGFLGIQIVSELAQAGYVPVVIARRPDIARELMPSLDMETRAADVSSLSGLTAAFDGCAAVHSTVAIVDQAFMTFDPEEEQRLIATNVTASLNVLRAAKAAGMRRVIVTGSASMRYAEGGALTAESSPPTAPTVVNDAYVLSKLAIEQQGHALARELGLLLTITMPGALYGPGDRLPSLFGRAIISRIKGNADPMLAGGMPLSDIRDVARAQVRIMELATPAPAYLLVAETMDTKTWHDLLTALAGAPPIERYISPKLAFALAAMAEAGARQTGKKPRFNRNAIQHVALNQQFDCSLARQELGLVFTPTETTLRDSIAWFRANGYLDG